MKRMLLGFVVGVCAGAFGYWYLDQPAAGGHVDTARNSVTGAAERVKSAVQNTVGEIRTEDIKRELERGGMVVREKITKAGGTVEVITL